MSTVSNLLMGAAVGIIIGSVMFRRFNAQRGWIVFALSTVALVVGYVMPSVVYKNNVNYWWFGLMMFVICFIYSIYAWRYGKKQNK